MKPDFNYRIDKNLPLDFIFNQINPCHTLP
jgi:hypothetical protein